LTPDPRYKQDFEVDNQKFAFSPGQLNKMLNPKSSAAFFAMAGSEGLAYGLRTDLTSGLSVDETELPGRVSFEDATQPHGPSPQKKNDQSINNTDFVVDVSSSDSRYVDRTRIFGRNKLPDRKTNGFFTLVWQACQDKIIILLAIAAVVSLALGIYEALSGGSKVDWIEGVAICVAILIVTIVTAANDWQKERQFAKLNRRVSRLTGLKMCPITDFHIIERR
jgi:Ca2+-transporting ATPase